MTKNYSIITFLLISNLLNLPLHPMEMEFNESPKEIGKIVFSKEEIEETEAKKERKNVPTNWKQLDLNVTREKTIIPQGRVGKTKAWINLNERDVLTQSSFKEYIEEQEQKALPFILSVLTTRSNDTRTYTFYSAQESNTSLFGEDFANNRYQAPMQYKDPRNNQIIIGEIYYFVITGLADSFAYLGSDTDIFLGSSDKKDFMKNYFQACRGEAEAQNNLGWMYRNGLGVEQDYVKAFEWCQKAADQGDAMTQNNVGFMYKNGLGVEQDYKKAVEWYQKAADQGNAAVQCNLGIMYRNGLGVEQNFSKAFDWFQRAADQGYAKAQNHLGGLMCRGLGTEQDYKGAFDWFQRAADQGYAVAQYNLGSMCERGRGVEKDLNKALELYQNALDGGFKKAQKYFERVQKQLQEENQESSLEGGCAKAQKGFERVQKQLQEENQEKHD